MNEPGPEFVGRRGEAQPLPYMTVAAYLQILRRSLPLIFALALLGGVGSWGYAQFIPKQYRSYASVLVIPERGESTSELVQGSSFVQNIVESYKFLVSTPYVLQPAIDRAGLDTTPGRLARQLSVQTPLNTVVIEIAVTDGSPTAAQRTADAITVSLVEAVTKVSPRVEGEAAVRLEIISGATLPQSFVSPDIRGYTLGGATLGLVLGLLISLLREQLRSRPRTAEDVTHTGLAVLGEIPSSPKGMSVPQRILQNPGGQLAESFRALAASLRFASVDRPAKVMIVTSADPADGKSSIATGLGLTLAEAGRRTLIIDADMRKPSVARLLDLDGSVGLTTVLVQDATLEDAVQEWGHPNLHVLTSGPSTPNPGHLMTSGQLNDAIGRARDAYDTVIVDSPPVLSVSDARWLAPLTDGVILVAMARKTPMRAIRGAIDAISSTHAVVFGLVLNRVRLQGAAYGPVYGEAPQGRRRLMKSSEGS